VTPSTSASERPPEGSPDEPVSRRALRFALLGGPVACIVAFMGNLFVVRGECDTPAVVGRLALVVLAALVSAGAGVVAWRSWQKVRGTVPPAAGGYPGRDRFFSIAGVAASVAGVLLSLGWLGVILVLDRCLRA
jgi:hypothetical protein